MTKRRRRDHRCLAVLSCRGSNRWAGPTAASILVMFGSLSLVACSQNQESSGDVYQVVLQSCIGEIHTRATAMAVSENLVATAAHSFDGASGAVLRNVGGEEVTAEVVYADFDTDIALLAIDPANKQVFDIGPTAAEAEIFLISYANAETGPVTKEGTVVRTVKATLDGDGQRRALELEADVTRGDSGGPVLDESGVAVGMVFASSRSGERGWAIAHDEIEAAVANFTTGDAMPFSSHCEP